MHAEAFAWVAQHATQAEVTVLDLGGRNVNGSIRDLFPNATRYVAVDIREGEGVDVVADASTWVPDAEYDVVVSTETFEHTAVWPEICLTAFKALKPGGSLILTMAGPGRSEHSAIDGGPLQPGEYYGNVDPEHLKHTLITAGFKDVMVDSRVSPADTRAIASK
jgi:predicted methyltransferase